MEPPVRWVGRSGTESYRFPVSATTPARAMLPGVRGAPMESSRLDADLATLAAHKDEWARLPIPEKIRLLRTVRAGVARVADPWVDSAVRAKGIPAGSPWAGEEWMSGPYSLLSGIGALERTLERLARGESPLPSAGAI